MRTIAPIVFAAGLLIVIGIAATRCALGVELIRPLPDWHAAVPAGDLPEHRTQVGRYVVTPGGPDHVWVIDSITGTLRLCGLFAADKGTQCLPPIPWSDAPSP